MNRARRAWHRKWDDIIFTAGVIFLMTFFTALCMGVIYAKSLQPVYL